MGTKGCAPPVKLHFMRVSFRDTPDIPGLHVLVDQGSPLAPLWDYTSVALCFKASRGGAVILWNVLSIVKVLI